MFLGRDEFLDGLKKETLVGIFMNPNVTSKLFQLSHDALAAFVTARPQLLALLPIDGPSEPYVQQLLRNETFLLLVPAKVHAKLAESEFRHHLTPATVVRILRLYPSLPLLLSPSGLRLQRRYLRSQNFLNALPCPVFTTLAADSAFVNGLSQGDVAAVARNQHMWRCLPVKDVRRLLRDSRIGDRLRLADVWRAVLRMNSEQSLDPKVVYNAFRYQVPLQTSGE